MYLLMLSDVVIIFFALISILIKNQLGMILNFNFLVASCTLYELSPIKFIVMCGYTTVSCLLILMYFNDSKNKFVN